MKKILLLIVILLIAGTIPLSAQNIKPHPIPSFNVQVIGLAVFQENNQVSQKEPSKGRRILHTVVTISKGRSSHIATVYFYSLDQQDILGPFLAYDGVEISEEIDEREWGVLVQSDIEVAVDTWINE